jgi:hypothetical protein
MRFCVRKADIPEEHRNIFEPYGANVIGAVLAGSGHHPTAKDLQPLYSDETLQREARDWLREQYDRTERWETWSLIMEIAITLFVLLELFIAFHNSDLKLWLKSLFSLRRDLSGNQAIVNKGMWGFGLDGNGMFGFGDFCTSGQVGSYGIDERPFTFVSELLFNAFA